MKKSLLTAFRGKKADSSKKKKSKSRRPTNKEPEEEEKEMGVSTQRRSSTAPSRSRQQHLSGRNQEPEATGIHPYEQQPKKQQLQPRESSSPPTPRQTNRTVSPRCVQDSPAVPPSHASQSQQLQQPSSSSSAALQRQKSSSARSAGLSRRDNGRHAHAKEGRDHRGSSSSNSHNYSAGHEEAAVVDSKGFPPLPLNSGNSNNTSANRSQQQQQQQHPPPPKRKSSSSSQRSKSSSKELGLDHLSLLSPLKEDESLHNFSNPDEPEDDYDDYNNQIPPSSSSASVVSINTIDTVTRSAHQLQSLIEQMQLEVTKLRSAKHAAECRANRLESDMERMQQEMENSVLKLSMENEGLKGMVEEWRLRCEELERQLGSTAVSNGGSGREQKVGGLSASESGRKSKSVKTKTTDGSSKPSNNNNNTSTNNNNNTNKRRQRSSDSSITSKSSRRSNKSQCNNSTPTNSPLINKQLLLSSSSSNHSVGLQDKATPKRRNKVEKVSNLHHQSWNNGSSVNGEKVVMTSRHDGSGGHSSRKNKVHNNNNTIKKNDSNNLNNNDDDDSSSSSSSSRADKTVDASSCSSPYSSEGGIWTPEGIKSGRMLDHQAQRHAGAMGREKVIDELVVDELYYA